MVVVVGGGVCVCGGGGGVAAGPEPGSWRFQLLGEKTQSHQTRLTAAYLARV